MLTVAKKKAIGASNTRFVRGDIHAIPLQSERYDIAICALALCHIAELKAPVREMARLLKPGGVLVVTDFHPACLMLGMRTTYVIGDSRHHVENAFHLV